MESKNENIIKMIHEAYKQDQKCLALQKFFTIIRESREYGLSFILDESNKNNLLLEIVNLLLKIANTWPTQDIPKDFSLIEGSELFCDTNMVLSVIKRNIPKHSQFFIVAAEDILDEIIFNKINNKAFRINPRNEIE